MGRGLFLFALLLGTDEMGVSQGEAGEVGVVSGGDSEAQVGVAGGLMNTESLHLSSLNFRRSVKDASPDGVWNRFVCTFGELLQHSYNRNTWCIHILTAREHHIRRSEIKC